ncbi:MAG: MFS transporter [Rikenellaceae bacterium]|nr:MFS transporter [Rikenellaceae bacterium]
MTGKREDRNPWAWIPSLYFAEGLPYSIIMFASVAMFKLLDVPIEDIALFTSLLGLPWVIKPLWSPFVDIFRKKRWWIISMQLIIAIALIAVSFAVKSDGFFIHCLIVMMVMAFASATHDISADGFYMIALREKQQALFVGIRSTFYRISMITGQGLIVILAGYLGRRYFGDDKAGAWSVAIMAAGILFFVIALYHNFILPRPCGDKPVSRGRSPWGEFAVTFAEFFSKPGIISAVAFMLLFRLGEAQLVKIATPFLLDDRLNGGLGISEESYGLIYGTIGVIALLAGGILGGIAISKGGLRKWILPMFLALNLPNIVYIYMAFCQPENIYLIGSCVVIEQLGYGFGFTSYMLFLIMFCDGNNKTAHYAIATGIMALGMMLPGMASGFVKVYLGYTWFFVWVLVCAIPGFFIIRHVRIPDDFGIKG